MSSCKFTERIDRILNDPESPELEFVESHLDSCFDCQQAISKQAALEEWRKLIPQLDARQLLNKSQMRTDNTAIAETQIPSSRMSVEPAVEIEGYEILEKIGSGGAGTVYRAWQQKLRREVAIKVLNRAETTSPGAWLRFTNEARAIAKLQHPGIIEVFDTGESNGLRYISQEFADGGSLAEKINHQPQTAEFAAQSVLEIARALLHMHENGMIHRDLKPANVLLVGGSFKLADFGLAKIINGVDEQITRTTDVMGTPQYMSPEQARGEHEKVGYTTDVYGLGVILYEMLCGFTPFRAATAVQTLQQVLEEDPIAPRVRNAGVPRDLDTICLKCIEKNPNQRYADVGVLIDDLSHFLAGRPITARPISVAEKVMKWCRRKPSLAALVAVVLVASVAGIVGWIRFTNQLANQSVIAQQNERAAKESLAAEQAAHIASTEMIEFLSEDLLDKAIQETGVNRELTVYDVVMDAGTRIESRFQNQPVVEATIRSTIGNSLNILGRYEDAIPHLERAVEIFDEAEIVGATLVKAKHAYAISLNETRQQGAAKQQLDELLSGSFLLEPEDELEIRLTYSNALLAENDNAAREYIENLVADCEKHFPDGHSVTADVLGQLGLVHHRSGEREAALNCFQTAYDMSVKESGPDHYDTLAIANNVALGLNRLGRFAESVEVNRDTLQRKVEKLGPMHQSSLRSARNLALGFWRLGEREKAISELVELLPKLREVHGVTEFVTLATINEIANMKQIVESPQAAVEFLDGEFKPILNLKKNDSVWGQILLVYCQSSLAVDDIESAKEYWSLAEQILENATNVNPAHLKKLASLKEQLEQQL